MSVDRLKRFFSKTVLDSEHASRVTQADSVAEMDADATVSQQLGAVAPASPSPAAPAPAAERGAGNQVTLPLLGTRAASQHQQILLIGLAVSLILLATVAAFALSVSGRVGQQIGAAGQSLMQSQRLAKSASQALVGAVQAFPDVADSAGVLTRTVRGLKSGDADLGLDSVGADYQDDLNKITPMVDRAEKNAATIMGQQKVLTEIGVALRQINRQSAELLEITEAVAATKLQQGAAANEIAAAGQLSMLTQRIGKASTEFLTLEGVSAEAVFSLGKDLNTFRDIAQGLLQGSSELRLPAARDSQTRQQLENLVKLFEQTRTQASGVLANLQGLVAARDAQAAIVADSEPLRRSLEELQQKLSTRTGFGAGSVVTLVIAAALALWDPLESTCRHASLSIL